MSSESGVAGTPRGLPSGGCEVIAHGTEKAVLADPLVERSPAPRTVLEVLLEPRRLRHGEPVFGQKP